MKKIILSSKKGILNGIQRVNVSVDWDKVSAGDKISGNIKIKTDDNEENIMLTVMNPFSPSTEELK